MAIWQYHFILVPAASIDTVNFDDFQTSDGLVDDERFWTVFPMDVSAFMPIKTFIPQKQSWSENIVQFGELDKSCCEIFMEDQRVVSVRFRVDFTSDYSSLLDSMIEFCLFNGISILDEHLSSVPLNALAIALLMQDSPQFHMMNKLRR
ncbi:hypothetical protein [Dyadobacter luticola]|uniref:Uncharacterized protein n=1 Tax=Dyadobacter luticola TaxID=1979387 RepID=A0A5R9L2J9_9BACT|nr:hypothetical protein [Dyadobacter luticola]TLV02480.1 hypothetical protein FEN17_02300 [Dyadobacter luticola]